MGASTEHPREHRVSANDGKRGWVARCSCGFWTPCTSGEDASLRMRDHLNVARALELAHGHQCWFDAEIGRGPAEDCIACQLEPVLKGRAA